MIATFIVIFELPSARQSAARVHRKEGVGNAGNQEIDHRAVLDCGLDGAVDLIQEELPSEEADHHEDDAHDRVGYDQLARRIGGLIRPSFADVIGCDHGTAGSHGGKRLH